MQYFLYVLFIVCCIRLLKLFIIHCCLFCCIVLVYVVFSFAPCYTYITLFYIFKNVYFNRILYIFILFKYDININININITII